MLSPSCCARVEAAVRFVVCWCSLELNGDQVPFNRSDQFRSQNSSICYIFWERTLSWSTLGFIYLLCVWLFNLKITMHWEPIGNHQHLHWSPATMTIMSPKQTSDSQPSDRFCSLTLYVASKRSWLTPLRSLVTSHSATAARLSLMSHYESMTLRWLSVSNKDFLTYVLTSVSSDCILSILQICFGRM